MSKYRKGLRDDRAGIIILSKMVVVGGRINLWHLLSTLQANTFFEISYFVEVYKKKNIRQYMVLIVI